MAYIKNVTDETAITGAFLNSDDTGLTTNVFLTEPRLYGLRVTKAWSGGPLLGSFGARSEGPYPFSVEFGGQIQRQDAPKASFTPGFADDFAAPLDIFEEAQHQNLDWGDGREVKLIYRPDSGLWVMSAALRYGKTSGHADPFVRDRTDPVCGFGGYYAAFCQIFADDELFGRITRVTRDNWAGATVHDREEHQLIDFAIGREFGLGWATRSLLSLSLRSAQFDSATRAEMHGVPDWNVPVGFFFPYPGLPSTHTVNNATMEAHREFDGAGPILGWEASLPLLDGGERGQLTTDWSVSAGALFGDRETSGSAAEEALLNVETDPYVNAGVTPPRPIWTTTAPPPPVEFTRSKEVTVPVLGASMGFAYEVDRFKVSAGYRWERYFDVLDGGVTEAVAEDRTIDGPYFKIAIGFGG
jgi:hypothetical protein